MSPILANATKRAPVKNYCAPKSQFRLTMLLKTCLMQCRCDCSTLLLPSALVASLSCSLQLFFLLLLIFAQYCEESTSVDRFCCAFSLYKW